MSQAGADAEVGPGTAALVTARPGSRAVIHVRSGSFCFRKGVVDLGKVLAVGRTSPAELVIPNDELLADVHFELRWDGQRCVLRQLSGGQGTLVGGSPLEGAEHEVPDGGWIRAGRTDFLVRVEQWPPAREPPAASPSRAVAVASGLRSHEALYAVLDAARDERVLELLQRSVDECRSLYEGAPEATLYEASPYLVLLRRDSQLLDALVDEGWAQNWGVFLHSRLGFKELRRHLRKFLMIIPTDGKGRFYFRFYDPRVLVRFLAAATEEQRALFFGEIESFFVPDEHGALLRLGRSAKAGDSSKRSA